MIKKILIIFAVLFGVVIAAFITGAVFIVGETQQVVITQFGKPVGRPITEAGLHFKTPFIQQAHYFDKRLLQWAGDPNQIPTKDQKYIWVDTIARWKITDALTFLQSVGNQNRAQSRLDDLINSATRNSITGHLLVEAVRNTNRIFSEEATKNENNTSAKAVNRIKFGREELAALILANAKKITPQYGIELIDVRIKRINYVESVRKKVYLRMIAERERAAALYKSEGEGKRAEIQGQTGKELKIITSAAYRKAEAIRGLADAKTTAIYANAYNRDVSFYSFIKTLETYRKTINKNSTLILTTNNEYYKYLNSTR